MASASAYLYQTATGVPSTPKAASSFSMNAPLLYDGPPGDTSTGYNLIPKPNISTSSEMFVLIALPSPLLVSKWTLSGVCPDTTNIAISYSTDGVTWSTNASISPSAILGTGTVSKSFTSVTALYFQFVISNNSTADTQFITDTRLYDGSGNIYGPPGSPVTLYAPAARNSQIY